MRPIGTAAPVRGYRAAALVSILVLGSGGLGAELHSPARADTRARVPGSTLIYGSTGEPDTLNPETSGLQVTGDVDSAVFDSLVGYDTSNRPFPRLASGYSVSPDGLSWTFNLRHGVKWADNQPFTSADVAFTYASLFNKKNNIISNVGWDQIKTLTTPDDYTVKMTLKAVFAPFLSDVGTSDILPKHIYDVPGVDFNKGPFNRKPFGTGPYMVSEWKTGDHITLIPNPYSWQGQPHIQKLIFKIVPNSDTELVQLRTGELDIGGITASLSDQARTIAGKRVVVSDANAWYHIDLKQYGFLREKAVRQALDYATPKAALLKGILKGHGQLAYADIDPGIKDYYNPNLPTHPYSLATASALLKADGFVKGPGGILRKGGQPFHITLWIGTTDTSGQKIEPILKSLWGSIGIDVQIRSQSYTTIFAPSGPTYTKDMTGISYAWSNPNDPDDTQYWASSQIPKTPTSPGNNSLGYFYQFDFQQKIDALTAQGVATVDTAKRRQIYYQIQAILADEVPVLFLFWLPGFDVIPTDLQGFKPSPFAHTFWNVVDWRRGA